MRGRQKENIKNYYRYETVEERRRRIEIREKIKNMKRENEILERKILFLIEEHQKMVNLIKNCCGQPLDNQIQKSDK